MASTSLLGALFALTSALVWGSGDFSGGVATRRTSQFQVLALSAVSGIIVLLVCGIMWGEALPPVSSLLWAAAAGASGAIGVAALYYGLSLGNTASVAPTASVVGAILPMLFSLLTEGSPGWVRGAGFLVALLGIWLVSQSPNAGEKIFKQGMSLAFLAGIGFGGFFILITRVAPGQVFLPLVVARLGTLGVALVMMLSLRLNLPAPAANPVALLAGVLDAGGNVFYLLAKQFTRLDVVTVLSSLYPAATMLLAYLIFKEKVSRLQWVGAGLCILAVRMIMG
jgi:drug/metabolite transporter (DMT)-like permease